MDPTQNNKSAWNQEVYQAWLNRFGSPEELAKKIISNPQKRISAITSYVEGDIAEKRVINLLGSNGNKAVAMAIVGADVTVVDFSEENKAYAMQLAEASNVHINYIVSDVLQLPDSMMKEEYDLAFMEFGILHYFQDLHPLFEIVKKLMKKGGQFIVQDFHPISTKLITSKGTTAKIRKHKVTGDYFDTSLVEQEVSYAKYLDPNLKDSVHHKVYLRQWTLGEIVTAIAKVGLCIKVLDELPNQSSEVFDKGIPKTFTIVAEK